MPIRHVGLSAPRFVAVVAQFVDHQGAAARLLTLGATLADASRGDVPRKVLADHEGNEFCVLAPA